MIDKIIKFIEFTNKFRSIERVIIINDKLENDAEHSYQLAMTAWYLIETEKLNLDRSKTLEYALIHDLVETYAGDTSVFHHDEEYFNSKGEREEKARKRITKEFPEFKSLGKLIEDYEKRENKEAKFIYALDKIIPAINIYLDSGRIWKRDNIGMEKFLDNRLDKVSFSPEVKEYFNEFVKILKKNKKDLFPY